MFWLVLAGLAIVGGVFKMVGQDQKNASDKAKLESQLPVYDQEQAALQAQLDNIKAEQGRARQSEALNVDQITRTAAYQELGTARQGVQAVGSQIAGAATGNVGGASILRRVDALKFQTASAIGLTEANKASDITRQELNLQSTLGGLNVQAQGATASLMQSQANEASARNDLTFLNNYGWMLTLGQGLSSANDAIKLGAPAFQDSSLATENFQQPYDYSFGGNLNLGGMT